MLVYYRTSRERYGSDKDQIGIQEVDEDDGGNPRDNGCYWEFYIEETYVTGTLLGLQAKIFDDAFRAFQHPEISSMLLAIQDCGTLDKAEEVLEALGFVDTSYFQKQKGE